MYLFIRLSLLLLFSGITHSQAVLPNDFEFDALLLTKLAYAFNLGPNQDGVKTEANEEVLECAGQRNLRVLQDLIAILLRRPNLKKSIRSAESHWRDSDIREQLQAFSQAIQAYRERPIFNPARSHYLQNSVQGIRYLSSILLGCTASGLTCVAHTCYSEDPYILPRTHTELTPPAHEALEHNLYLATTWRGSDQTQQSYQFNRDQEELIQYAFWERWPQIADLRRFIIKRLQYEENLSEEALEDLKQICNEILKDFKTILADHGMTYGETGFFGNVVVINSNQPSDSASSGSSRCVIM